MNQNGGNLALRLVQHFVRRDSSLVTGTSAVGVNIEHVSYVEWWESDLLHDENQRHAAELIAFDVLDPALVSRGNPRKRGFRSPRPARLPRRNRTAVAWACDRPLHPAPSSRSRAPARRPRGTAHKARTEHRGNGHQT
jgi:hypothetical protein